MANEREFEFEVSCTAAQQIWKYALNYMIETNAPEEVTYQGFLWGAMYYSVVDLLEKKQIEDKVLEHFELVTKVLYQDYGNTLELAIPGMATAKSMTIEDLEERKYNLMDSRDISKLLSYGNTYATNMSIFSAPSDFQVDCFMKKVLELRNDLKSFLDSFDDNLSRPGYGKQTPVSNSNSGGSVFKAGLSVGAVLGVIAFIIWFVAQL